MHLRIAGSFTGRFTKWVVVAFWVVMLVALGPLAGKLDKVVDNDAANWLPHSAESTSAMDRLQSVQDPDDIPTTVVYHRAGGLTKADFARIREEIPDISRTPGITRTQRAQVNPAAAAAAQKASARAKALGARAERGEVPPQAARKAARKAKRLAAEARQKVPQVSYPRSAEAGKKQGLVSEDGQVAVVSVMLNLHGGSWDGLLDSRDHIQQATQASQDADVRVYVSGTGGQGADQADAFSGIDGTLLYAAAGVVVLILLITYRSPVLWALPLVSVVVSLVVSMGAVYLLAEHAGLTLNGQSKAILDVLVFGAGTDYALLLIARYREELRNHRDRHEAMAFALHRAAPAILASGATVALGMLCLLAAEMGSTRGLGPVCAVGIVVCLVVMLTLLPALLVVTGRWVFWPARPAYGSAEPSASGLWARLGQRIASGPRRVWVGTALVLAACCAGLLTLHVQTLSGADQYTKTFDSNIGDQLMQDHGLADMSSPIRVVSSQGTEKQVVRALHDAGLDGARAVTGPSSKVAVTAVPISTDPLSQASFDKVRKVRSVIHGVDGADAMATGTSAVQLDAGQATARDARLIIPLVLGVVLVILMVLLRAVVAPLVLMATVVLSFGAALGLSGVLFRALGFAGEGYEFPLYVFVFLVALGIDYNIFLMTRVREETVELGSTRRASVVALSATGGVITSAGVVLAATFAVLGTLPFVAFVEIGVAVALGVLLDTLVVRSVLVTALNLDLGDVIWWPSRLSRAPRRPAYRRPARPVRPAPPGFMGWDQPTQQYVPQQPPRQGPPPPPRQR